MRTLVVVLCSTVLAVGVAGCGATTSESSMPKRTTAADALLFGDCRANDPALDGGAIVAEADLDGSGAKNEIAYVAGDAGGPCANVLFTTFDGEHSAVSLGDGDVDADSVKVVRLSAGDRELLLSTGDAHPRGGFQPHIYGLGDDGLAEITADGNPLLSFVATDGGGLPGTAICTDDGGIAVLTAVTHEPPGVILAWDVTQTTYSLDGTSATETSSKLIKTAAADPTLQNDMPQLFDPDGYFADCIVGTR